MAAPMVVSPRVRALPTMGLDIMPIPPAPPERYEHAFHLAAALATATIRSASPVIASDNLLEAMTRTLMAAMEIGATFHRRHPAEAEDFLDRFVIELLREHDAITTPLEMRERDYAEQVRLIAEGCDE